MPPGSRLRCPAGAFRRWIIHQDTRNVCGCAQKNALFQLFSAVAHKPAHHQHTPLHRLCHPSDPSPTSQTLQRLWTALAGRESLDSLLAWLKGTNPLILAFPRPQDLCIECSCSKHSRLSAGTKNPGVNRVMEKQDLSRNRRAAPRLSSGCCTPASAAFCL